MAPHKDLERMRTEAKRARENTKKLEEKDPGLDCKSKLAVERAYRAILHELGEVA